MEDNVSIHAHRGAAGGAPENTIASIRASLDDGSDWGEIDVQESPDGEIVVVHNSDLMKLAGEDMKIWAGTFEELRRIDIGSWFGEEFSSECIPTLGEVFEEMRGKAKLLIELKYYGHNEKLEQRFVDIVEQAGMVDEVAYMSGPQTTRFRCHELSHLELMVLSQMSARWHILADRKEMNSVERLLLHKAVLFGQPLTAKKSYRDQSP